jgi:hypothetical protein
VIKALHENDYDVARTIEFFFEGGDLSLDWKTVGERKKQTTDQESMVEEEEKEKRSKSNIQRDTKRSSRENKDKKNPPVSFSRLEKLRVYELL